MEALPKHWKATEVGQLYNMQLNRPTKKYNHKIGTYHLGFRIADESEAKRMLNDMHSAQIKYQKEILDSKKLDKALLSLPYHKPDYDFFYHFEPFRMNCAGWDTQKDTVFVNLPKIFDKEEKQIDHKKLKFSRTDFRFGRVFYTIDPYWNQEGVGIILRLQGLQFVEDLAFDSESSPSLKSA